MHIGILTGGGDCPGLNAAIRGVVHPGITHHGDRFTGFEDGWRGPLEGVHRELKLEDLDGVLSLGGTMLGSSRTNVYKHEGGPEAVAARMAELELDALVTIGGDDTIGAASRLHADHDLPIVGIPKTIDNDLDGTDTTIGFDTAAQIAGDAIDRVRTTAESHHRNMVIEVMGRDAGWIALQSGLAGGADVILIPEVPFDIEQVCGYLTTGEQRGKTSGIIVVAEGAAPPGGVPSTQNDTIDEFGHVRLGGIGAWLAPQIEHHTGRDTRGIVLGHLQRGGTPTAFDRALGTRFGLAALDAVHRQDWGMMAALRGQDVTLVPLAEAVARPRLVPAAEYARVQVLFG